MMRLTRLGGYALAAAAVVLAGVVVPATLGAAQSLTVTRYAGTDRFDTAAQRSVEDRCCSSKAAQSPRPPRPS